MKEKYIDERYPSLLTFNMPVLIPQNEEWSVRTETIEDAQRITAEFEKIKSALVRCAQAFDDADHEAFQKFWYVDELSK